MTNYIQKEIEKGFSQKLILEKLLQAGYTKQEIKESLRSLKKSEPLIKRESDLLLSDVHVQWGKWVFPILAILVLLFLSYLIFLYTSGKNTSIVIEDGTGCNVFEDARQKDICLLHEASSGKDVCDKIMNPVFKTACVEQFWNTNRCLYESMTEEVSQYCEQEFEQEKCISVENEIQCLVSLAIEWNNPQLCNKNYDCIVNLAIKTYDGTLCHNYLDAKQELCSTTYAQATGDRSFCSTTNLMCMYHPNMSDAEKQTLIEAALEQAYEEDKVEFLIDFATAYQEPLACKYIILEDEKSAAVLNKYHLTTSDFCYIAVASAAQDATMCNTLTESYKNQVCNTTVNCPVSGYEDLCDAIY